MADYFLPVYQSNAIELLVELLPGVRSGAVGLEVVLDFCQLYRIKGICSLFMECAEQELLADLQRSGRAFAHFTATAPADQKLASRSEPLFDALSSRDFACAAVIAAAAPTVWKADEEYEDDFLYFRFLFSHFFLGASAAECEGIVERYEAVLDGKSDARLVICRAFLDRDAAGFDAALRELISTHESRYDHLAETESVPEEVLLTEGNLFVEGLGLLALAEKIGIRTESEYPYIPGMARSALRHVPGEDSWITHLQ